jgi:hypothetical protein
VGRARPADAPATRRAVGVSTVGLSSATGARARAATRRVGSASGARRRTGHGAAGLDGRRQRDAAPAAVAGLDAPRAGEALDGDVRRGGVEAEGDDGAAGRDDEVRGQPELRDLEGRADAPAVDAADARGPEPPHDRRPPRNVPEDLRGRRTLRRDARARDERARAVRARPETDVDATARPTSPARPRAASTASGASALSTTTAASPARPATDRRSTRPSAARRASSSSLSDGMPPRGSAAAAPPAPAPPAAESDVRPRGSATGPT